MQAYNNQVTNLNSTLVRLFLIGLSTLFSMALLTLVALALNITANGGASASVVHGLSSEETGHSLLAVDPPTGTLDGISIDHMETLDNWKVMIDSNAISAELTITEGYSGNAIQMDYNLGITTGAWVQLQYVGPTLDLSSCDHLRFFYRGTASNTLQIGVFPEANGANHFSSDWNRMTHVPWWTFATFDFQGIVSGSQKFTDAGHIEHIFISVKIGTKDDVDDVGGLGSFTVDELQCLNIESRTVPSDFEPITVAPTVTLRAADWISDQQQSGGLLKSWQEESWDSAWLYSQALGLIVLSDNHHPQAHKLAAKLHELQNEVITEDGSWYDGYHYLTDTPITTATSVGSIAWTVYALQYYSWRTGVLTAAQDAREGAEWLASLQRPDGCLPAVPGDSGAPTEPNLDAWWAFKVTGHLTEANLLQNCLLTQVWDSKIKRFKSSPDDYHIFLDNQTWGASFLKAIGDNTKALQALSYARWTLATCSSDGSVCGFDGGGPFSVWNEGTLQYVAARGENSQYYWDEMVKQQAPDGGLPASPDNFSGYMVWLTTWHGIAPTAWLYYPGTGGPFYTAIAVNDTFTTDEDITLTVAAATGVFSNDIALDDQPLTATLESGPSHSASFALAPDGSFTYTPRLNFYGNDSFTYRAIDSALNSNVATVLITVEPINDPPTLDPIGNKTISESHPLTFTAIATDVDVPTNTLTFSLEGAPDEASIDPVSGIFTWTPTEAQGPGDYTVTVRVTDDGTPPLADSETIAITVHEVYCYIYFPIVANEPVRK